MTAFRRTSTLFLAFSHLHECLPAPDTCLASFSSFETLAETLRKTGIARLAFLRHGATAKSQGVDFDRKLTDQGRKQAKEAGSSFGKELLPYHPRLFVSPAPRTVETAELFLQSAGIALDLVNMIKDPILYDGTMQPAGSKLFQKIGYAPLNDYLNAEDDEDRKAAREVLGAYAHNVTEVIAKSTMKDSCSVSLSQNSTLLMVGHAIYLPAVALGIASLLDCDEDSKQLILSTNTLEAQGYLIDTLSGSVRLLVRPSNEATE
jgi:broad specificity phosphatase PhoE